MTQRRRSFGAVERLASGRFRASYVPARSAKRVLAPHTFATEKQAGNWLDGVAVDLRRGVAVDYVRGSITLSQYGRRFLTEHRPAIKESTAHRYDRLWLTRVEPALGSLPLRAIQVSSVRGWVAQMSRDGLAPRTVLAAFRLLSLVLNAAGDDGEVPRNPCAHARKSLPRMPKPEPRILSPSEVAALRAGMGDGWPVLLFDVLRLTGVRIGEALALRRRHVDVLHRVLHVERAVGEVNGRLVEGDTKTHQKRAVTLPDTLLAALVAHLDSLPASPDTLLFPSRAGTWLRYGAYRRAVWDPACVAAGLAGAKPMKPTTTSVLRPGPKPKQRWTATVTPHDLRATHGSVVAAGHGPLEAARRLGHADATVLLAHYARPLDGGDRTVAEWLDGLVPAVWTGEA